MVKGLYILVQYGLYISVLWLSLLRFGGCWWWNLLLFFFFPLSQGLFFFNELSFFWWPANVFKSSCRKLSGVRNMPSSQDSNRTQDSNQEILSVWTINVLTENWAIHTWAIRYNLLSVVPKLLIIWRLGALQKTKCYVFFYALRMFTHHQIFIFRSQTQMSLM